MGKPPTRGRDAGKGARSKQRPSRDGERERPRGPRPPSGPHRRPSGLATAAPPQPAVAQAAPAGLAARRAAVHLVETVLRERRPLPRQVIDGDGPPGRTDAVRAPLEPRDRAFAHAMGLAVLRRHGSLAAVLDRFITKPLPTEAARARMILLVAAAQILLLATPVHAAVALAVEHCRRDRAARHFDKLANAVLRRVATEGPAILAGLDGPRLDVPQWLWQRWSAAYGERLARAIAAASLAEPPLDLSPREDAAGLAARLGGIVLPTGSIRLGEHGRVEAMPGYADGAWWVQDAAAALPVRLLGNVGGQRIADLCAAPGGKTAMLAVAGARVTAVDVSADRLATVRGNLERLRLAERVELVATDLETWQPTETFDGVLLDAPCTATGTIRRHPDILHLKEPEEIGRLAALQARLLARAAGLVRPGGLLVYCVCSLEPEEGPERIAALLATAAGAAFEHMPLSAGEITGEIGGDARWLSAAGDLRTLPCHAPAPGVTGGMDGFYAARLRRRV